MHAHRRAKTLREWDCGILLSHSRNADSPHAGHIKLWPVLFLVLALFLGGCSALQERAPQLPFGRAQEPETRALTLWAYR